MSIRVLHVIPTLDRGGAEKQLSLLARNLPRDRFDVRVCALTRSGPLGQELKRADIPVHVVGKRWKVDPAAFWRLRRHIRQSAPDLVQTWLFAANCYGRQAAFSLGVPSVVATERCADHWKVTSELAVDRYLARRTQRIVVNGDSVRGFYLRRGIPAEKLQVIPNAIEPLDDRPGRDRGEWSRELNLPADARWIGAVGRLWPQKRVKDLIWAADLLKVIRDDTHLLIVGDGPQRRRLERFREQVRIEDRVHFLGHRDDVPDLLPHLDCLWLASGYEGQSNAIMEAMSAGVPVVATDIAANRELIEHRRSGMLVPVGDRAAMARHTDKLLNDPESASRLSDAGRKRMLDHFSVQAMVDRYAELYEDLVKQQSAIAALRPR